MQYGWAAVATVVVVTMIVTAGAVVLHYLLLVRLGVGLVRKRRKGGGPVARGHLVFLKVFSALFALHATQIVLFGVAYWGLLRYLPESGMTGAPDYVFWDSVYLSAITYTTVGFGDVSPTGPIRILAAIESLIGFMLITWSASFGFINMERHWRAQVDEEAGEEDAAERDKHK